MIIRMWCFMNQRWGGCLSQSLKFNVCSCWSPSALSLMFGSFPPVWQFISQLLTRSLQESYPLSYKEIKIPKCAYRRSFLPVSDFALTDILNKDIFTSTELCTPEFLLSQEHSYHSGKHHPRDTAGTSDNMIEIQEVVTNHLFSTDWTTPTHSKLLSRLWTKSFPDGEVLQFLSQNKVCPRRGF